MIGSVKNYKNISIMIIVCFFIVKEACALDLQFIVTVPPVITEGTVVQFDVFGSGTGAQVFIIIVDNSTDSKSYTGLTLRYKVDYYQQGGGSWKLLYEGLSNEFTILAHKSFSPISSKNFLKKNNPAVPVSLKTTVFELSDSDPLKKQFLDTQKIPDGKIRYTMILRNSTINIVKSSEHVIINTSKVELVTPGSSPSGLLSTVFDLNPVFIWNSDIPPNVYGGDDVFEIRVYKAGSGESAAQAMSKVPVVREGTTILQYKLPDQGYRLIPGATYYWEVIGFIKGIATSEIKSSPFRFKMSKTVNPKVSEVINIIKPVYNEATLEKIYDFDSDVTIKIDGQEKDVNELRELVQKILLEEYSIHDTKVE